MKLLIETVGFKPSPSLKEFSRKKITKLERLHKGIILAELTLEMNLIKTKEIIRCTLRLSIPGKDEFLKSSAAIFEDAILKVVEKAQRRLRIRKTQRINRNKPAGK